MRGNRFVTPRLLTTTRPLSQLITMKHINKLLIIGAFLGSSLSGQTLSVFELPEGNEILQFTGADAIGTGGGPATADTRTLYYLNADFGDPQPNTHDWDTNMAWPYVFVTGSLSIDPAISATVSTFDDGDAATGDVLLIDGNPLYQFVNDNSATDANGNFGPWFYIEPDGTATQSAVPEPSTFALLGGIMALGVVLIRRKSRNRS